MTKILTMYIPDCFYQYSNCSICPHSKRTNCDHSVGKFPWFGEACNVNPPFEFYKKFNFYELAENTAILLQELPKEQIRKIILEFQKMDKRYFFDNFTFIKSEFRMFLSGVVSPAFRQAGEYEQLYLFSKLRSCMRNASL